MTRRCWSANNTFGTPAEDAMRRDLTINAMFYNIADYSIVDYVGGLEDLRNGRIRAVGEARVRFLRDPVRMMRAVRHAARAGFNC
jgi:poly(A) polymerase